MAALSRVGGGLVHPRNAAFVALGPDALDGLVAPSTLGTFSEAFFFSVHTFATIGYGDVTPASWQADVFVTLESLVGLLSFGLAAGLMFARFARPNARIIFSRNAMIAPYRGGEAFEFRIVNGRKSQIIEFAVRVILARHAAEGGVRSYHELSLERETVAIFPLGWTFVQTVHARSSYRADELVYGARFASTFDHEERSGLLGVDLARVHDVLPAPLGRNGGA